MLVIGLIGWVMNIMDVPSWSVLRHLSVDLDGARSVTLREYAWDTTLLERKATGDEIERLTRIAGKWPRPFYAKGSLCFEPHHDIVIVRVDGSEIAISICFLCGNILYRAGDKSYPHPIPAYFEQPLRAFFASVGMKPKSLEEYDAYGPEFLKKDTGENREVKK
ncbi:MAG: hypothetical protein QOD84_2797 [Acidobacteriaceae bacterium]